MLNVMNVSSSTEIKKNKMDIVIKLKKKKLQLEANLHWI